MNGRAWRARRPTRGLRRRSPRVARGDVVDVRLPMTLRTEPLPGAPDVVAFAYGPIVLAGRLGTEGVTPEAQIIKNERESGNMLNARGRGADARRRRARPRAARAPGAGRAADVRDRGARPAARRAARAVPHGSRTSATTSTGGCGRHEARARRVALAVARSPARARRRARRRPARRGRPTTATARSPTRCSTTSSPTRT